MPLVNRKMTRLAIAKEGCEDSNREACLLGHRVLCEDGCGGDEECLAQCLELRPCDQLFPDSCQRCRKQCFTELDECFAQCPTCETDPDGIECQICRIRCECASANCIYDNCRTPCGWDAPQGAASARSAFQSGDLGASRPFANFNRRVVPSQAASFRSNYRSVYQPVYRPVYRPDVRSRVRPNNLSRNVFAATSNRTW